MIRLMIGQTNSDEEEVDIFAPVSKSDNLRSSHYSMSFDITSFPTAEDNISHLKTVKEEGTEEEYDKAFYSNSEEDSDDDYTDYCGQFDGEVHKAHTINNIRREIPAMRKKRIGTTGHGPAAAVGSPVEQPRRRSSHSISRMNAFRRSKLGSCISMELFPSTQVRL